MSTNASTSPLYVALDMAKNVHCFGGYAGLELRPILTPREVRSTQEGYAVFRTWLEAQVNSGCYAPILVGMEPTGIYHEAWAYAVAHDFPPDTPVQLQFVNPYRTQQKRRQLQAGRHRKSDPLDVEALAHCLRDASGDPAWLRQGDALRFEVWAADFRQVHREQQRLQISLQTQFDRLWPGALVDVRAFRQAHPHLTTPEPLVLSHPLLRQIVRVVLTQAANPHAWLDWSVGDIQAFFRSHDVRCGPVTAQRVFTLVHQAVLPPSDLAALLAERVQRDFLRYLDLEQQLMRLREQAEALVPHSPAAVLTTFTGISTFLAAQYMAYVGDVQRFAYADQIWSLAGFDLSQDDSGDRRRAGRITKRGDPGLRSVLFAIGLNTSQHCAAIAQAKRRAAAHGKHPIGAIIHAAHKANRICFALLKRQTPFDPQHAH